MDARKHLIIIKGKDQTDSVASFQFLGDKCEIAYTSAPNKSYSFQSSNVKILPLQKKIDPAQVIVAANGQTISEIDELLDFGGYYRIVRNGKKDLSFRRNEVQFQQNCLADGKNLEAFQYFKETAAAISLVTENDINILSIQYNKITQVSEDTVLANYDSENLMYSVIQEVLAEEAFSSIGCAEHVSLATLVKDYEPLTAEERKYARNPLTHVDFLLFNQMDKRPVLAIEVDGTAFHKAESKQAERDMKKNSILEKCAVPLLRLRTDGSGEKEKIRNALKRD